MCVCMCVCVCSHALDMTWTARKSVHVCGVCGSVLAGLLLLACTRACTHTGCSQSQCSADVLCVLCSLRPPVLQLVLSYHLSARIMCEYTRDEWVNGLMR